MYAAFLYDAVYQYAVALNKTLASNEQPDGKTIISKLLNKEYNSKYPRSVRIFCNFSLCSENFHRPCVSCTLQSALGRFIHRSVQVKTPGKQGMVAGINT